MASPAANLLQVAKSQLRDRLLPNESLLIGQILTSKNGTYAFVFQRDGNTVIQDRTGRAIWSPGIVNRGGVKAIMQNDGNFVVYTAANQPVFNTGTQGRPNSFIVMQDDGNLVIYQNQGANGNKLSWESRTHGGTYHEERSDSPFAVVARTLGGAAKGLANGVAVAAKWSGKAFVDVTNSPLWKIAAGVAPFVLPGIGLAVSAGMVTAAAIGKAGSVKDAIIGAVRANVPGGEAGKAGFDVGVGIAIHGEGMTEAGLNAVRNQIPNGPAKAGFDAALTMHAGRVLSPAPAPTNLSPQGKGAFYATIGLVKVNAPAPMKVAVSKVIVTNPEAQKGLHAAINEIAGKEISWLEWIWLEVKNVGAKVHSSILKPIPKNIITVRGERVL